MATELLTAKDVARRYGVTESTVWKWNKRKVLPEPLRMGSKYTRWKLHELEQHEADIKSAAESQAA